MVRTHEFNIKMRQKRTERNWSLATLSEKVGASKSYVSDIEQGKYAVSIEIGFAICQLLRIPIEDCMSYIYEVEMERVTRDIRKKAQDWYESVPTYIRDKMISGEWNIN